MSATNATPTINLPLFIGTDKPAWLTDWNGAMNVIDSSIASLQTAEGGTATALATLSQSVSALSETVSQHTTAIQTVTTATAGNTGSINTINSLIGNGTPTTTDKTIIGAINEINAKIPEGDVAAEDVTYDNTDSGLTATDVQAAIDELAVSEAYSTTEVDTGKKWIDEKAIYRRVVEIAQSAGATSSNRRLVSADISSYGIDHLISFGGYMTVIQSGNSFDLAAGATIPSLTLDADVSSAVRISSTGSIIGLYSATSYDTLGGKFVLEYTKTA